MYKTMAVILV